MLKFFHYRNRAERLKKVWQTFLANEPAGARCLMQNQISIGHLVKIAPEASGRKN
jgi:hypothetical protein